MSHVEQELTERGTTQHASITDINPQPFSPPSTLGPGAGLSDINVVDHGSRNLPPTVKRVKAGFGAGLASGAGHLPYRTVFNLPKGSREPLLTL